jgi:hypothetical protein
VQRKHAVRLHKEATKITTTWASAIINQKRHLERALTTDVGRPSQRRHDRASSGPSASHALRQENPPPPSPGRDTDVTRGATALPPHTHHPVGDARATTGMMRAAPGPTLPRTHARQAPPQSRAYPPPAPPANQALRRSQSLLRRPARLAPPATSGDSPLSNHNHASRTPRSSNLALTTPSTAATSTSARLVPTMTAARQLARPPRQTRLQQGIG